MGDYSVWNILILLCLWCSASQQQQPNDNLWDAYQKCKNTLGKPNWLCDPNHRVDQSTAKELNDLLWKFQTEVPCYCKLSKDCYRYGNLTIMSGVVASMIVVDSFPPDYGRTIKRIYDDANLDVRGTCSNGLLVVVGYKTYEMFTYRGMLTGTSLTERQAKDAMNRTALELQATDGTSRFALPMLLNDYIDHLKVGSYGRSRNWEAMVGMVVAALICAIAAAVALAIFFTSCCLKKRRKPWRLEKAALPPVPSQKELEQQRKMKVAALKRLKKQSHTMPNPKTKRNMRSIRSATMDDQYYHVSEPPSTMYSTLPRAGYAAGAASYYSGYGYPDAEMSMAYPATGREAATLGARGRRRSLPIVDPSAVRSTTIRTSGTAAAGANPADASFDSSTSASQAYLIPPYHLPLHLEREVQSRNYNFADADETTRVIRDVATPVVSTPKLR